MSNFTETFKAKWPTYFFEIIVIILGLLGAFWLDNWNEERNRNQSEINILKEIKFNLSKDFADLSSNIKSHKRYLRANNEVLKHLNTGSINQDSLEYFYSNIAGSTLSNPNVTAYENLKSIGFDIIQNDSLRQLITQLYTQRYGFAQRMETEWDVAFMRNQVIPDLLDNVEIDNIWQKARPMNFKQLKLNKSFKEMLKMNIFNRKFMISLYSANCARISNIVALINKEIDAE